MEKRRIAGNRNQENLLSVWYDQNAGGGKTAVAVFKLSIFTNRSKAFPLRGRWIGRRPRRMRGKRSLRSRQPWAAQCLPLEGKVASATSRMRWKRCERAPFPVRQGWRKRAALFTGRRSKEMKRKKMAINKHHQFLPKICKISSIVAFSLPAFSPKKSL